MPRVDPEIMKQFMRLPGDVAEMGVHNGNSSILMAPIAKEAGKTLYLVDSFTGMPESTDRYDKQYYPRGKFGRNSIEKVRARVGPDPVIIAGILPAVLNAFQDKKFCFVYLDIDHYTYTFATLIELIPRMTILGGILCDDAFGNRNILVDRAIKEFMKVFADDFTIMWLGQQALLRRIR